jgi:hypothetical protein
MVDLGVDGMIGTEVHILATQTYTRLITLNVTGVNWEESGCSLFYFIILQFSNIE